MGICKRGLPAASWLWLILGPQDENTGLTRSSGPSLGPGFHTLRRSFTQAEKREERPGSRRDSACLWWWGLAEHCRGCRDGCNPQPQVPSEQPPSLGSAAAGRRGQHKRACDVPFLPIVAAHPRSRAMLGPITAAGPCHSRDHTLPGALQTQRSTGCIPEAAAVTAPKSKIPSLWLGGRRERLCPHVEQQEGATCQLFSQSIFH